MWRLGQLGRPKHRPGADWGIGTQYEKTGTGPMVKPTIPSTPSVANDMGVKRGNTRTFELTAEQLTQKIANFPLQRAKVWGYNGSSPGPTLVSYEGEKMRVIVTNTLPEPTTIHLHGLHQPNDQDGVAGISQPTPIPPRGRKTYEVVPGHVGTFSYHSHFETAVQDQRGLSGMITVLPKRQHQSVKADDGRRIRWTDRDREGRPRADPRLQRLPGDPRDAFARA